MRIYFQDLKEEIQKAVFEDLMETLEEEMLDYRERAEELGMDPQDYLKEEANRRIESTANYGVEINF
jgi:hypothetical protein